MNHKSQISSLKDNHLFENGYLSKMVERTKDIIKDISGKALRNNRVKEAYYRLRADDHEMMKSAYYKKMKEAEAHKMALLYPIYAGHLGMSVNELTTVLHDYPKDPPSVPAVMYQQQGDSNSVMVSDSGTGESSQKSQPEDIGKQFALRATEVSSIKEYEEKLKQHLKRKKVETAIRGLHKYYPEVRKLAEKHDKLIEKHRQQVDNMDPIVNYRGDQIRTSELLRLKADRLKSLRTSSS